MKESMTLHKVLEAICPYCRVIIKTGSLLIHRKGLTPKNVFGVL